MSTKDMTNPQPSPAFQTPNPEELQSEQDRASVMEKLSNQQGGETDVVDDRSNDGSNPSETAVRHLPALDTPPG